MFDPRKKCITYGAMNEPESWSVTNSRSEAEKTDPEILIESPNYEAARKMVIEILCHRRKMNGIAMDKWSSRKHLSLTETK